MLTPLLFALEIKLVLKIESDARGEFNGFVRKYLGRQLNVLN